MIKVDQNVFDTVIDGNLILDKPSETMHDRKSNDRGKRCAIGIQFRHAAGWQKNKRGSPERLEHPSAAEFAYANDIHGKYDNLKESYSIAVDKTVIPKKAKVEILGLGERVADDSGGAIDLYHIDNFLGSGKAVVKTWLKGGINGTKRRVKYLGNTKLKFINFFFTLTLITFSSHANAGELKSVYMDENNNVHLVTNKDLHRQITNTGNSGSLKLAPNKETVAWLVLNAWTAEGGEKPGSEELAVYRNGRTTLIKCTPYIRDYWFWKNGEQIAIDCSGRRFAGHEILYDVRTLKEIASFDQAEVPIEKRPDWSNSDD